MKRQLFAILLIIAMILTGCGNSMNVDTVPAGTVQQAETEPELEEKPVSMGRMEGGTYINEYTGYACDLDNSWTFMSAEELQEMPANVRDLLEGSELGENIDVMNQFTDMMAENVDQLVNMNVVYQKLTMKERIAYAMMNDSQIVDATLELKDQMVEAYEQAGFEVESMEKVTVEFLGEERAAMHSSMSIDGVPYYLIQLFDYRLGSYGVTLTLASFVEDNTERLLELFYNVE